MNGSAIDLATGVQLPDGSTIRAGERDGMIIEIGDFASAADPTPFFAGLPDDRCQCPHWGYVIAGELRFRFADREEVVRAGEAYHVAPGHLPVIAAGTRWVEFSPAAAYAETAAAIARNMARLVPAG